MGCMGYHRSWIAVVAMLCCATSAGCPQPEPQPEPATGINSERADTPTVSPGLGQVAVGGAGEAQGGVEELPVQPDYWEQRFGARMRPEVRERYRRTPQTERFTAFSGYLISLQQREALLQPYSVSLSPEAVEAYWELEGVSASRRWLEKRFPEGSDH